MEQCLREIDAPEEQGHCSHFINKTGQQLEAEFWYQKPELAGLAGEAHGTAMKLRKLRYPA